MPRVPTVTPPLPDLEEECAKHDHEVAYCECDMAKLEARAKQEERERCMKAACPLCAENVPAFTPCHMDAFCPGLYCHHFADAEGEHHVYCNATEIRLLDGGNS